VSDAENIPEWKPTDIRAWATYNAKCPNCGADLQGMHPMANLYPHWTGACVTETEETRGPR